MTSIAGLARALQTLFTTTADDLARESGFVQRHRKLTGSVFAQALVFGWLQFPAARLRQLQLSAATAGATVSPQAIAQRCTAQAATFLERLVGRALDTVVTGTAPPLPLLGRFPAVVVLDSTTITLPAALASVWQGCGGSTPEAGSAVLKVQLRYDLCRGGLDVLALQDGRANDQRSPSQTAPLPAGALRLADRGYFSQAVLADLQRDGVHFLTHPPPQLTLREGSGPSRSLARYCSARRTPVVDRQVVLGAGAGLACRLLAVRVPPAIAEERRSKERAAARREGRVPHAAVLALCGWTVLLTSLAPAELSVREALVLARARWQVELVFKLWKSAGNAVDAWRSADPWQVLCTVYAKLLGALVQHWLLVSGCWDVPDKSLPTAAAAIRARAWTLLTALRRSHRRLVEELSEQRRLLHAGAHVHHRKARPAHYQLLANAWLTPVN